jgi:hypothetical protein
MPKKVFQLMAAFHPFLPLATRGLTNSPAHQKPSREKKRADGSGNNKCQKLAGNTQR